MSRSTAKRCALPMPLLSGFYTSTRLSLLGQALEVLANKGEVVVVALCAERALVRLRVSPAEYNAFDAGPVDAGDPLNAAHYYRVRPRLPQAR